MPSGVRRKKHNRSSIAKNTRKTKQKEKKVRIHANPIIAANWDNSLTLSQNYKKLGLRSKLSAPSGGEEKDLVKLAHESKDELSDSEKRRPPKLNKNEGRIIRDDEGNVVKIEYAKNEDDEEEGEEEEEWAGFEEDKTEVIKQLEEHAANGVSKPHHQSDREKDWVQQLVEKHGDDYEAMFWDKKLNIWQQSVGELKRRVYKWKKQNKLL